MSSTGSHRAPTLAVIGGGQLARMMAQPAIALGPPAAPARRGRGRLGRPGDPRPARRRLHRPRHAAPGHRGLRPWSPSTTSTCRPTHLHALEADGVAVRPGPDALVHAQDKAVMRRRLAELDVPCPRNAVVTTTDEVAAFGLPCVLKTTRGGYDGKGVWVVRALDEAQEAFDAAAAAGVRGAGRGARRLPARALRPRRPLAQRPGRGVPGRRLDPARRHLPRGRRPRAGPLARPGRSGAGDRPAGRRCARRHGHPRRRALRDDRRPDPGQRAGDAPPQHRPLDPGRRRDVPVRESPARRHGPPAGFAGPA